MNYMQPIKINNNFDNIKEKSENNIISVIFYNQLKGTKTNIITSRSIPVKDLLILYMIKIGEKYDYIENNWFFFNGTSIDKNKTIEDIGIMDKGTIVVSEVRHN